MYYGHQTRVHQCSIAAQMIGALAMNTSTKVISNGKRIKMNNSELVRMVRRCIFIADDEGFVSKERFDLMMDFLDTLEEEEKEEVQPLRNPYLIRLIEWLHKKHPEAHADLVKTLLGENYHEF
jgi:hypothetical protein